MRQKRKEKQKKKRIKDGRIRQHQMRVWGEGRAGRRAFKPQKFTSE